MIVIETFDGVRLALAIDEPDQDRHLMSDGAASNLSGPMTTAIRPDAKLPAPCSSFHDRGAMATRRDSR